MLGKEKFLPPKLPLLLQHNVSASLSSLPSLYALHMVYGKSSVSAQADP
jgi:hypothetical protein